MAITWAFHGFGSTRSTPQGVQTTKFGAKSSILMIESVTSEHSGNYTCTARNSAGVANYTAELVVNGDCRSRFRLLCKCERALDNSS